MDMLYGFHSDKQLHFVKNKILQIFIVIASLFYCEFA